MKKLTLALLIAASLTACGTKDASFDTLEMAKAQVRENALFNGQRFRQENIKVQDWSVIPNGDSSQMPNCPQGDGWATLTFVSPARNQEVKVKCSTASAATGCLYDAEFKTKSFASEDGACQPIAKVPFPIPKIAK